MPHVSSKCSSSSMMPKEANGCNIHNGAAAALSCPSSPSSSSSQSSEGDKVVVVVGHLNMLQVELPLASATKKQLRKCRNAIAKVRTVSLI